MNTFEMNARQALQLAVSAGATDVKLHVVAKTVTWTGAIGSCHLGRNVEMDASAFVELARKHGIQVEVR